MLDGAENEFELKPMLEENEEEPEVQVVSKEECKIDIEKSKESGQASGSTQTQNQKIRKSFFGKSCFCKESAEDSGSTPAPTSVPPTQNQSYKKYPYHDAAFRCNFGMVYELQREQKIKVAELDNNHANCLHSLVRTQVNEESDEGFKKITKTLKAILPQQMDHDSVLAMLKNENKNQYTAMERAAFDGKRRILRLLIDRYIDVTNTLFPVTSPMPSGQTGAAPKTHDKNKLQGRPGRFPVTSMRRTLLHSAASAGQTETAQDLLKIWPDMIDFKDIEGSTALHMAANYRHDSVVMLLIEHGASLSELDNGGEPVGLPVMCISKAREGVLKRLDQSLSFEQGADGPYKKRHKIKIDLNGTILSVDKNLPESSVLSRIAELDVKITEKFLLHPVCLTFVELKLQRLRVFCYVNIVFYFTFVGLFTALCFQSGVVTNTFSNHTREMGDNITREKYDNIVFSIADGNQVLSIVTTVFASLCVLQRFFFFSFYISALRKIRAQTDDESSVPARDCNTNRNEKNWWGLFCEIVKIAVVTWTISVIWSRDTSFVEHSVSFLFLIFWCKSVFLFEVFSSWGKYIMMLQAVLQTFTKIFIIFIPLLVGFLLAFCVVLKGTFSIPKSVSTMLAMMLGEYDEKNLFSNSDMYLPITGHIIFIFFILVLSIVLINFWVGISVSDVSSLALISEIRLAKGNIERLRLAEELALFMKKLFCGYAVFWEQLKVLSDEKYGIIHVSLKKPDTKDLFTQNEKLKKEKFKSKFPIQEYGAYILFQLGMVLNNTSLYRKHPIDAWLQYQLESVAVTNIDPPKLHPKLLQEGIPSVSDIVRRAEEGAGSV